MMLQLFKWGNPNFYAYCKTAENDFHSWKLIKKLNYFTFEEYFAEHKLTPRNVVLFYHKFCSWKFSKKLSEEFGINSIFNFTLNVLCYEILTISGFKENPHIHWMPHAVFYRLWARSGPAQPRSEADDVI